MSKRVAFFFFLAGVAFILIGLEITKVEKTLAAICQGQCSFGDEDCGRHCKERGICPLGMQ